MIGGWDFVIQCAAFLLKYELTYVVIGALAILVVSWLVRFIIQLWEDRND
jgi:hypothetical protein